MAKESIPEQIQETARKLVNPQQMREWRFRSNLVLALLIGLVMLNLWRVYRNESIWNRCVEVHPEIRQEIFNGHL